MPIQATALARGGAVLVTTAATVALLAAPAVTTEAEAHDGRTNGGRTNGGQAAETRQIASSVLDADENIKFTLTAIRSTADPLRASVRLKAFMRQNGKFVLSDEVRVGAVDGWFWFPVTGRGAICEFSTASTNPAPITTSLLITPAIGCSPPQSFELRDGKFEANSNSARTPRGGVSAGGGGMSGRPAPRGASVAAQDSGS
ncbi:hypothetical protein E0500_001290 [Streptomyces sp. KM273126]|uniref:hypothetical protein n=1 Tax=Streptomyces sp. KM273126 TaxID=2545247 RepID=UPI0015EBD44A|nr:hypothetical protein [Streptomyces sp. KM273126]MBA2806132.1 hypothetical protein [Streptomyces sp. KM273126]